MLTIALGLLGGAAFHLRGSEAWYQWTGRRIGSARIMWAFVLTASAWLVAHESDRGFFWPILLFLNLWFGAVGGWGGYRKKDGMFDGTLGTPTFEAVYQHTGRGLMFTCPAAIFLRTWDAGWFSFWLVLAGLQCGPVYYACRIVWPKHGVALAECVWGTIVALAVLLTVQGVDVFHVEQ